MDVELAVQAVGGNENDASGAIMGKSMERVAGGVVNHLARAPRGASMAAWIAQAADLPVPAFPEDQLFAHPGDADRFVPLQFFCIQDSVP